MSSILKAVLTYAKKARPSSKTTRGRVKDIAKDLMRDPKFQSYGNFTEGLIKNIFHTSKSDGRKHLTIEFQTPEMKRKRTSRTVHVYSKGDEGKEYDGFRLFSERSQKKRVRLPAQDERPKWRWSQDDRRYYQEHEDNIVWALPASFAVGSSQQVNPIEGNGGDEDEQGDEQEDEEDEDEGEDEGEDEELEDENEDEEGGEDDVDQIAEALRRLTMPSASSTTEAPPSLHDNVAWQIWPDQKYRLLQGSTVLVTQDDVPVGVWISDMRPDFEHRKYTQWDGTKWILR